MQTTLKCIWLQIKAVWLECKHVASVHLNNKNCINQQSPHLSHPITHLGNRSNPMTWSVQLWLKMTYNDLLVSSYHILSMINLWLGKPSPSTTLETIRDVVVCLSGGRSFMVMSMMIGTGGLNTAGRKLRVLNPGGSKHLERTPLEA